MELNTTFSVICKCNKFDKSATSKDAEKVDLTLKINATTASYFLFRFQPEAFNIGEYKVLLRRTNNDRYPMITLFKDDYIYIVSNPEQVYAYISAGYYNIRTINKLNSLLSIDFETMMEVEEADECDGVVDEFDLKKDNN